ncbi:DUF4468 domain-containing protein [uncultured Mucilaginibacter sp.]|uniref:DUF4468 domain-containing protein n=1 Tax=uncultured Mucilaginibacter sp. TaxID=797541 RepID=UPI00263028F3|nr:DUF4468 domain-containing protein [uncultured Mucilaginibacter sp.]
MKKFIIAALFLLPLLAKAQSGPFHYKVEDRYLYYGNVVEVDTTLSVADLYKDAKLFLTKLALINTKITKDDATNGVVIASVEEPATFKTQTGVGTEKMTLRYNIKLELKKGRYRYTFDNIILVYDDKVKGQEHTLYDVDKGKGGGLLGIGLRKRVLTAMDDLFLKKIDVLTNTMKKKSDDF